MNKKLKEEPSECMIKALEESARDTREGSVSPIFDNPKDAIAWLKDKNRKYKNEIQFN